MASPSLLEELLLRSTGLGIGCMAGWAAAKLSRDGFGIYHDLEEKGLATAGWKRATGKITAVFDIFVAAGVGAGVGIPFYQHFNNACSLEEASAKAMFFISAGTVYALTALRGTTAAARTPDTDTDGQSS